MPAKVTFDIIRGIARFYVAASDGIDMDLTGIVRIANLLINSFKLETGAGAGKILTSDAEGNASWETPTHAALSGLTTSGHPANIISVNTDNFDGSLSASDVDVQTALQTLDNYDLPVIQNNIINLQTIRQKAPVFRCGDEWR